VFHASTSTSRPARRDTSVPVSRTRIAFSVLQDRPCSVHAGADELDLLSRQIEIVGQSRCYKHDGTNGHAPHAGSYSDHGRSSRIFESNIQGLVLPSRGPGRKVRNIRRMFTFFCPLGRTAHGEPDKRSDISGAAFEVARQTAIATDPGAGCPPRDCPAPSTTAIRIGGPIDDAPRDVFGIMRRKLDARGGNIFSVFSEPPDGVRDCVDSYVTIARR
jgi:hypothetical protein